jgi:hypothetical protein
MKLSARTAQSVVRKWRAIMGLEKWEIGVRVLDAHEDGHEADVDCEPGYRTAHVTFYADALDDLAMVEAAAVHELAHVLTWDMRTLAYSALKKNEPTAESIVEAATEGIAHAVLTAYRTKAPK